MERLPLLTLLKGIIFEGPHKDNRAETAFARPISARGSGNAEFASAPPPESSSGE
jgi:hypothetical protein